MTPTFTAQIDNTCLMRILDTSYNEYISENQSDLNIYYQRNKFKYSDTITINIIYQVTTDGENLIDTLITNHCVKLDEVYYSIPKDGCYIIKHIIIPTTEWLNFSIENSILPDLVIFVTDGKFIYQYANGNLTKIDSKIIAEINTENTTISRSEMKIFSLCNLQQCYIKICKQIFNKYKIRCIHDDYKSIVFNRDFVWMTLNIIKYHIEFDNYLEAQRILENINYCGGFCEQVSNMSQSGCGCSKT